MIKMEGLTKTYVMGVKAVDNLNIEFKAGSVCGFIGHNGAGKTTTLKMLTGILKPSSGKIFINDKRFLGDDINSKKLLAYVPDKPMFLLELTGREYLNFILDIYDVSYEVGKDIIEEFTVRLKIKGDLNKRIESYSHGMRKKLLIIGAFLSKAKILILDEPLTGLDPEAIYILKDMIKDYAEKGNIVIFSTHLLDIAQEICTEFIIMNKGIIKFSGDYKKMEEVYGEATSVEHVFMEIIKDE